MQETVVVHQKNGSSINNSLWEAEDKKFISFQLRKSRSAVVSISMALIAVADKCMRDTRHLV